MLSAESMTLFLRLLGRWFLNVVREAGSMMLFLLEGLGLAFVPPFRPRRILEEVQLIGVKSTMIVILTAAFTGMVLALQGYYTLRKYGSEGALGSAVALSLIREMGPVLTGIMVSARAGSAVTAEPARAETMMPVSTGPISRMRLRATADPSAPSEPYFRRV